MSKGLQRLAERQRLAAAHRRCVSRVHSGIANALEIVKFKSMVLIVTCHDSATATTLVRDLETIQALAGSQIKQTGAVITVTEPTNSALWPALKANQQLASQRTIQDLVAFIEAVAESTAKTAAPAPTPAP